MRFETLDEWQRRRGWKPHPSRLNLAGFRSGSIVGEEAVARTADGTIVWRCKCDCGETTFVRSTALHGGYIRSCGRGDCNSQRRKALT